MKGENGKKGKNIPFPLEIYHGVSAMLVKSKIFRDAYEINLFSFWRTFCEEFPPFLPLCSLWESAVVAWGFKGGEGVKSDIGS